MLSLKPKLVFNLEVELFFPMFINIFQRAPKLLKRPKGGYQGETSKDKES